MRKTLLVGVIVILAWPAVSHAQAKYADSEIAAEADPTWLVEVLALLDAGDGKGARRKLDILLNDEPSPQRKTGMYILRAGANAALNDVAAMRSDLAKAMSLSADPVPVLLAEIELGSHVDPGFALAAVTRLAEVDPVGTRALDEKLMSRLLQVFKQENRDTEYDELVLSLAKASYGGVLSRDDLQLEAARIQIKRGHIPAALDHARQVTGRSALIDVLTDRQYAALWAGLEQSVGRQMETPARANLARAEVDYREAPDNIEARLQLMRAHAELGEWEAADKLGREVGRSREELLQLDERSVWIIDEHATILEKAGRLDEADARRAALVQTWDADRYWIVSNAINRIDGLVTGQRFAAALTLLDQQKENLERYSSSYAKQLLRAYRVEALRGLGRMKDAEAIIPDLLKHGDDAVSATLTALILLGHDDSAEPLAVRWLGDPRYASAAISVLRVADDWRAIAPQRERIAMFRSREAVRTAFEARARDLPVALRRTF